MINVKKSLLTSIIIGCTVCNLHAVEDDLFSLSIEELLRMETDVAGFTSESIASSPSVVTVFTEQDIQAYALDNVFDLMNFVPGFQTTVGEKVGAQTKLQSRGVYLDNGYVLIMIDGVKINEISFGKASVYTPFIDLAMAQKVEIIRGPGSAVYGSNAFLGVINIVTKKDDHLAVGLGKNSESRFHFGLTESVLNGELAASFSYLTGQGDDYSLIDHQAQSTTQTNQPYEHQQMNVSWSNQYIEIGYRNDSHELDGYINLNGYHPDNYYNSENQYWYANANVSFNESTSLNAKFQHADHNIESAGFIVGAGISPFSHDVLQGPYWGTQRKTFQAMINHKLSSNIVLSIGTQFEKETQDKAGVITTHVTDDGQSTSPAIDIYYQDQLVKLDQLGNFDALKQEVSSQAWFAEVSWQIDDMQKLYVGGRYEDYTSAGDAFSPRISYIRKLNGNNQIKAIYSQAFRAPVTNELYSNDGVTFGNDSLKPELVETTEIQWLHNQQAYSVESTLFHTKMKDLIVNKPIDNSTRTSFFNEGQKEITGLELLANINIMEGLKARGTYTYYFDETVNGQYDYFSTASLFWSRGKWQTNLHLIYRPGSTMTQDEVDLFQESSHLLINASLQYKMGRNLTLGLAVRNGSNTNSQGYEPRQSLNAFSIEQPKRHISIEANYSF
jgi:outer membrane receptor for ferrienterochelin and colicins